MAKITTSVGAGRGGSSFAGATAKERAAARGITIIDDQEEDALVAEELATQPLYPSQGEEVVDLPDSLGFLDSTSEAQAVADFPPAANFGSIKDPRHLREQVDIEGKQLTEDQAKDVSEKELEAFRFPRLEDIRETVFRPAQDPTSSYNGFKNNFSTVIEDIGKAVQDESQAEFGYGPFQMERRTKHITPQALSGFQKIGAIDPDGVVNPNIVEALSFSVLNSIVNKDRRIVDPVGELADVDVDNEGNGFRIAEMGIDTFADSKDILETARRFLVEKNPGGVDAGGVNPALFQDLIDAPGSKEATSVLNAILTGLMASGYFKREVGTTTAANKTPSRVFIPTDEIRKVLESIKPTVKLLQRGLEKRTTHTPNTYGQPATELATRYKRQNFSADLKELWDALTYFGSEPNVVARSILRANVASLTHLKQPAALPFNLVDAQGVEPSVSQQIVRGLGMVVSSDPMASDFEMDTASMIKAFNASRPREMRISKELFLTVEEVIEEVQKSVRARLELENLPMSEWTNLKGWWTDAADIYNGGVFDAVSSNYELARELGEVIYFPLEVVGLTQRMRIASQNLNFQQNSSDRGGTKPARPILLQGAEAKSGSSYLVRSMKAMIARLFDIDGAEHTPSFGRRVEIFNKNLMWKSRDAKGHPIFDEGSQGEQFYQAYQSLTKIMMKDDQLKLWATATAKAYQDGKSDTFADPNRNLEVGTNQQLAAIDATTFDDNGQPNTLTPAEAQNLAEVLKLLKPDKEAANGLGPKGKNKEGNLLKSGLLSFGLLADGKGGLVELQAELDGINNSHGFFSILLGIPTLAKRSGMFNEKILNGDYDGTILDEGDVRYLIFETMDSYIDNTFPVVDGLPANYVEIREKMMAFRNAVKSLEKSDNKKIQKDVWKKVVMVFGYGLTDGNGLAAQFAESLSALPDLVKAIKAEYAGDPSEVIELFTSGQPPIVRGLLNEALSDVFDYADTVKMTGKLAAVIKQELTIEGPAEDGSDGSGKGFESNLTKEWYDYVGHEQPLSTFKSLSNWNTTYQGVASEGTAKETYAYPEPLRAKRREKIPEEGIAPKDQESVLIQFKQPIEDFYENPIAELDKVILYQGNRAPVALVHLLDSTVMVKVANRVIRMNKKLSAARQIHYQQVFDAVIVDPYSFEVVQNLYNEEMLKAVREFNPYTKFRDAFYSSILAAEKNGDVQVARVLLAFGKENGNYIGKESEYKNLLAQIEKRATALSDRLKARDDAWRELDKERTYTNTTEQDEKTWKLLEDLKRDIKTDPELKMPRGSMRALFDNSGQYNDMLDSLKKAANDVETNKRALYEQIGKQQRGIISGPIDFWFAQGNMT